MAIRGEEYTRINLNNDNISFQDMIAHKSFSSTEIKFNVQTKRNVFQKHFVGKIQSKSVLFTDVVCEFLFLPSLPFNNNREFFIRVQFSNFPILPYRQGPPIEY